MYIDYNLLTEIELLAGDSCYILDIEKFEQNYHEFRDAFAKVYPNVLIAYSYKTNYIPLIGKTVDRLGGFAEVVSEMEYSLAEDIGVTTEKIIVNGPYKTSSALEKYLTRGSIVNLDSYYEIELVKEIARKYPDKRLQVGLRCNFEIKDRPKSRFGFDVQDSSFIQAIKELILIDNVQIVSIHSHYPFRELSTFPDRVDGVLKVYDMVLEYFKPKYIGLGGGWGGKVDQKLARIIDRDPVGYIDYANTVCHRIAEKFSSENDPPILVLEPGTAIVADTMLYVSKIIEIKKIRDKYIATSTGSKVHYQPRTSNSNPSMIVYSESERQRNYFTSIDIGGYTCMEEDYIYRGYCGELEIGDYIVVENVGSYSIVFKPPFIHPNVPVIAKINEKFEVIKEPEDYQYLFSTYKIRW